MEQANNKYNNIRDIYLLCYCYFQHDQYHQFYYVRDFAVPSSYLIYDTTSLTTLLR